MQNGPRASKVDHTSFYVIIKFLIGRGDVTFLSIAYTMSTDSQNVEKLTCVYRRGGDRRREGMKEGEGRQGGYTGGSMTRFSVANTDFEGGDNGHDH